jgi:hypothetical protein
LLDLWRGPIFDDRGTFRQYLIRGRERQNPLPNARYAYYAFFQLIATTNKTQFPSRVMIDGALITEMIDYSDP